MAREKFATQLDPNLIEQLRALARADGRQLQSLVNEAVSEYVERRHQQRVRPHVMAAYERSHEQYASVYRKLAK